MNLQRCNNGHLYDSGRHSRCPYCESEGLTDEIKDEKINLVDEMDDDDKTVAYWSKDSKVDPVVGWLTCIEGPDKGKDYRIVSERNFIGRGDHMDICINGDSAISRNNHCSISYNPKERKFVMTPGSGNGLVYINNAPLYETKQIFSHNFIEIGESKFVFVELCGQHFDWNKEKTKDIETNKDR